TWNTSAVMQRWTTMQDDFTYDNGGSPAITGIVDRNPRYSWAWMVQQTKVQGNPPGPPTTSAVNLYVIVYDRRVPTPGATTPLREEIPCTANFVGGSNTVNLSWSSTPPVLKRGTWILDASTSPNIHGYFYRVVNVVPTGPNSAQVEIQTPAIA